jgi:hypothetical protein
MNERIQELAYLAEDYADSIVDQGGEFHETYTKKLAELLIRECISLLPEDCQSKDGCHTSWTIKEHFGV